MIVKLGLISVLVAFSSSALSATPCEWYVSACVNNKNNRMGKTECICVWNKAVETFNDDQLAFLLATAAKDQVKTHALMAKLGQQVMPVMAFAIKQPSNCVAMEAAEEQAPSQQDSATVGETSSDAAVSAGESASQ